MVSGAANRSEATGRALAGLVARFSADVVSTDAEIAGAYGTDWTRVHEPAPLAVAFPRTTEEVAGLLRFCSDEDICVVPSGGRTGLAGGAVAARGELVLSLERMRRMDPVCRESQTVRVQAGAVTQAVHEHCRAAGLIWPVDFASSGSSQIGGNIATNAGGIHVIRYGSTRAWVLGLEVVTMAGEVLQLGRSLEKDNAGLDLKQLIIGSEGTLAVITEATLKLAPTIAGRGVAFLAVGGMSAALELLTTLRGRPGIDLHAFEYLGAECLDVVLARRALRSPLGSSAPAYVLVEVAAPAPAAAQTLLEDWLAEDEVLARIQDGVVSQSASQSHALWQLREGIGEALAHESLLHKNDIAVPVHDLPRFHDELTRAVSESCPHLELFVFGHVGDGNLHVNLRRPAGLSAEQFRQDCDGLDRRVWDLVSRYGGSLSAEHGIGLLKKKALPLSRTARELELYRAIKRAFDPKGLLNPGKVFD